MMRLAYCTTCSPVVVVAAGDIPVAIKRPPIRLPGGRQVKVVPPKYAYTHTVGGVVHGCKLVAVAEHPRGNGESAGAYLARLGALYAAALV